MQRPGKAIFVVFLVSFGVLAWNIGGSGIAAAYVDPIAKIRAQDEAPLVNSAIAMANHGDWMTPKVMGRLFLFKPPLLVWLTAISIRMLGLSLFAVRLPALLFGAAGVAAVFAWVARARSTAAGALAAGILLASPFWQTFSRLCLTDVLCASCSALALAFVAFDPQLSGRRTRFAFAIFGAAAILAKSVAGLLPFAVLVLFWIVLPRERRPRFAALVEIAGIAAVVLAPWYIYQIRVHPQWFWAENIQGQIVGTGLHWDRNSPIRDLPVVYYLRRLVAMDPLALALLLLIRPKDIRQRPAVLLGVCWLAITVAALCAFQAASLPYLVLLLPPLLIVGAACMRGGIDSPWLVAGLLGVILVVKSAGSGQPWSMRPSAMPPVPGAAAMRAYYDLHRANELISVDPDDQFYSMTIALAGVRYSVLDPSGILPRFAPHYSRLGIVVTSDQYLHLASLTPLFGARLQEWGVDSQEAVASTITMNAPSELSAIVDASPDADFYLPARWMENVEHAERDHLIVKYSAERVFLLSRAGRLRSGVVASIPVGW